MGEYNGALMYTYVGVEHPSVPPRSDHIRGKVLLGGWRITQENDRCRVVCISVCDPCRPVPSMLAQQGAEQSFKSMQNLRKLLKDAVGTSKKKKSGK